jgi:multicomponent Na+:H+ antiporter subunit G
MNQQIMEMIGGIVAIIGSIFLLLGSIGIVRMPDTLNRIQTGTKATTLGTILSLAGLFFFYPGWVGKLFILVLFVLITNPVSSHVLARAAYFVGVPLTKKTVVDKLHERDSIKSTDNAHLKKVKTNEIGD